MNEIEITDFAAKHILKLISAETENDALRIEVKGGGCSGFQYVWDFKDKWPDVQWSEPYKECLVLDPMAEMYIAGCTIDYVEELGGSYLKIINPNATASCGCGESFAI